ncbi:MAG: heme o synthase [Alphaproteobacteria bacterium]|nr:heme o synthase [Alphaproteobacteria bacterium]MDE2340418.1 heme o synthase [Alphaproteobacteria bacterium]
MTTAKLNTQAMPADWRDLVALTKPRVMSLVVFTGAVGMLATQVPLAPVIAFSIVLSIALGAGAAAALNQWYEADIDARMKRTRSRPLPAGRLAHETALHFGVGLSGFSVLLLGFATNWLAATCLAASILFYVFVYTIWLKRRTPQNIVIGGAAGAFPPLIGWVAATGRIDALPLLMFALIFVWTPPHFWALALYVESDYAAAGVPMLPVVAGEVTTRRQILLYAALTVAAALAPFLLHLAGLTYALIALPLSLGFAALSLQVGMRRFGQDRDTRPERRLFFFSILYLFLVFGALGVDRWLGA